MSDLYPTPTLLALLWLNANGEPDLSGPNYWEVETIRHPDRTWYTVQRDGWLVAEVYDGSDGWRIASRPREPIPTAVLTHLPAGGQAVLSEHSPNNIKETNA